MITFSLQLYSAAWVTERLWGVWDCRPFGQDAMDKSCF